MRTRLFLVVFAAVVVSAVAAQAQAVDPNDIRERYDAYNAKDQGQISIPVDIILFRELNFVGSFGMQAARFPEMLEMVKSKRLNPDLLVGKTVTLDDASDVLASLGSYDTMAMSVITSF